MCLASGQPHVGTGSHVASASCAMGPIPLPLCVLQPPAQALGGEQCQWGAQQLSWLIQNTKELSALAVPSVTRRAQPAVGIWLLLPGEWVELCSRLRKESRSAEGCCSLQSWIWSWLEGFLLEMLAQGAGEITHRGKAGLL